MKHLAKFFTFLLFAFSVSNANASGGNPAWANKYEHSKSFIENKGQFNLPYETTDRVEFAYDNSSTRIYFTKRGLTYSFLKMWKDKEEEGEKDRDTKKPHFQDVRTLEEWKKKEAEEHKPKFIADYVTIEWENSNPNVQIVAEQKISSYFSYTFKNKTGAEVNENFLAGYEKITYKNLYPNIDVEYVFHPSEGIKYSITLHPGADPSLIKMKYDESKKLAIENGNLTIATELGKIIDHAPITFYGGNVPSVIKSNFVKTGNSISFQLDNYDNTKTVIIDPWTVTPSFATNWDCVWECEKDGAGNVYIIGGVTPLQLIKYNSTGAIQWTYNTPYDTTSWLGTFATDNIGNSYVANGSTAAIIKVNTAGGLVWNNPSPGGLLTSTEFWSIAFNCDQSQLVIGGTGNILPPLPHVYNVDVATGNVTANIQVTDGALFPTQEVRSITACGNGKFYWLTHDSIGFFNQNFSFCPSGGSAVEFHRDNTYGFGYKCENWRYDNTGINAIRANTNFVYTHKGNTIHKRDLITANIITSAAIPGGSFIGGFGGNQVGNAGIDIDNCGNVYVGSTNAVLKYDANLVLLATYPTTFNVYDVHVTSGGDIIACGTTGNSGTAIRTGYIQQITAGACAVLALTCCNTAICTVPSVCLTAAPFNLTSAQTGGTWSGTGITNASAGTFSPAVSGVGTFIITYTLPCGSETVSITVNPCTALILCQGPGALSASVSGGTGPYQWQTSSTTNPCVAGLGFCGGTPFSVAGPPVTVWTTFFTGSTATLPGTYPIQIVDAAGTIYTIANAATYAALAPCSGCPTLTANITAQVNVACFGASTGSFNVSTTGGATPWDYTLLNGATTVATFTNVAGTQAFTGLPAGTYTLNIVDNNGCPGTATITITQPVAGTTTANAGPNQTVCGTTATLAGNTATVGTGAWSLVSGAGTITSTSLPNSGVTGLGVGPNVFMWTISNPPCPSTTSTVTITGVATPTVANAGPAQSICGTTATLAGNTAAAGTGTWTLVSGAGTITTPSSPNSGITGLGVGPNVFQWSITNAPCPPSTSTVTITGVAAPTTANAGPAQTVCGTTATLAGNTATTGTGTWTLISGAGTITTSGSPTSGITGLGVGPNVFQWSITNAPCPPSTSTVTITGVATPTVAVAGPNQTLCSTTFTMAGNTPSTGTGTWTLVSGSGTITTPGSATTTITSVGAGANVFMWTISNPPCPNSTSTVTLTNTGGPTTSIAGPPQSVCATTATLAGNTPTVGTGLWTLVSGAGTITTPASPTSGVTGLGVGPNVFEWTISNPPCTPSTSTVTITGVAAPTSSNAGATQVGCSSTFTMAGNAPTVGTGTWTVISGSGTITTPSSPTTTITGVGAGTNVFMWTIDNPPCPASTDTVTLINTGGPTTSLAGTDQTVCNTTATLAGNTPLTGTGAWTVIGGTATVTTPSSPTSGVTGLSVGPNVFVWTISSPPCAPSTDTIIIIQMNPVSTSLAGPNQTICSNTATLAGNTPAVGTGTWTLVSGAGTITTPGSPTTTVTGLGAGANVFMWTISNPPCPSSTSTVTINNTGGPSVSTTSQTNVDCNGNSSGAATVAGSGGAGSYTYSWTGGAGASASATGLSAGSYTVTITDGAGCSTTTIITITQPSPVSGVVSTTTATCGLSDGAAAVAASGGTGALTYSWSPGGATTASITGIPSGLYTVTITDSLGCVSSASGTVGSVGGPAVNAGAGSTIVSGGTAILSGTGSPGVTFSWSPAATVSCPTCATTVASPTQTTTYTLTVTINGCTSYDTVTVFVEIECGELFVPNVFSPNGDGNNDELKVYGNCIVDFEFVVFDRWGQKVFEITDPAITWDGRFNGKMMDAAVFVYYLKGTVKGIDVSKHGNITLVK